MRFVFGFSLFELTVSAFIVFILATIGTQSYFRLVEQARANTVINELFYHLAYARSEAIKRNSTVTLCASFDGDTCADGKYPENWSRGFIVFEDKNIDRQKQKSEKILLVQGKAHKNDKLFYKPSASGYGILQFTSQGGTLSNPGSFLYCPHGELKYAKAIFLNRIGRSRIGPPEKKQESVCAKG